MRLRDLELRRFRIDSTMPTSSLQALELIERLRSRSTQMPYLFTFESELFQHWQSEWAEIWVAQDSMVRATLKYHVGQSVAGPLLRIEDLFVDPSLRSTLVLFDLLENFLIEVLTRWPQITLVGLGETKLDILTNLYRRRCGSERSQISRLPQLMAHKAWSRLYTLQSNEVRWLGNLGPMARWQVSRALSGSNSREEGSHFERTQPTAASSVSVVAGLREWRWPAAWRESLTKFAIPSMSSYTVNPPFPVVALDFKNKDLTASTLRAAMVQLAPELRPRERPQVMLWIRDPWISEEEVQCLQDVLKEAQLSLQVSERRILILTSCQHITPPEIYKSLNLQASQI